MNIGSGIAVYFIMWWVTLFMVLPFGIRSQAEAGEVSPGSDPGAPASVKIGKIMLINSLVALVPFGIFYQFILPMF
jgi:predicted secreted protein